MTCCKVLPTSCEEIRLLDRGVVLPSLSEYFRDWVLGAHQGQAKIYEIRSISERDRWSQCVHMTLIEKVCQLSIVFQATIFVVELFGGYVDRSLDMVFFSIGTSLTIEFFFGPSIDYLTESIIKVIQGTCKLMHLFNVFNKQLIVLKT